MVTMDEKWHANHRTGMAAAAAKTAAHRLPGPVMAEVKRRAREHRPCKVKGCKRTAYKGAICKAHWRMIPMREKAEANIAMMTAQLRERDKWHRRFLRELNARAPGVSGGVTGRSAEGLPADYQPTTSRPPLPT